MLQYLQQRKKKIKKEKINFDHYYHLKIFGIEECWKVSFTLFSFCFFFFFFTRVFIETHQFVFKSATLYTISLLLFASVYLHISRTSNHHLKKNTSFASALPLHRVKSVLEYFGHTRKNARTMRDCKIEESGNFV